MKATRIQRCVSYTIAPRALARHFEGISDPQHPLLFAPLTHTPSFNPFNYQNAALTLLHTLPILPILSTHPHPPPTSQRSALGTLETLL